MRTKLSERVRAFMYIQRAASVFGTDPISPHSSSLPFHDTGESATAKTMWRRKKVFLYESATSPKAAFEQITKAFAY